MIVVVRPCNHDDTRHLYSPVIEHLMVRSTIMSVDGIIEGVSGAGHAIHRFQGIGTSHAGSHKTLVGGTHVVIEAFRHIVQIVRITHGGTVQAIHGFALAQPQTHHIEVDVAQCLVQNVLMLDSPRDGALELRNPDETDGALGAWKLTAFNQFVQSACHFNQGNGTGDIVVGTQLHISFIKVGTENDFLSIRISSLDNTGRHFDFGFFHSGLDIRFHGYLLASEQSVAQGITVTRSEVDTESGVVSTDTTVRNLDRVYQRTRRIIRNDTHGTCLHGQIVYTSGRSFGHGNLALQVGSIDFHLASTAYPSQFGGNMGTLATLSQDSGQIAVIGQFRGLGRYFPKGSTHTVPSLGLAQLLGGGIGKAITFQLIHHILGLHEESLVIFTLSVSFVGSNIQDVIIRSVS